MNNTTNSWEEFKKKICTCDNQWLADNRHHVNCPIFELSTLLHDNEIAAYDDGFAMAAKTPNLDIQEAVAQALKEGYERGWNEASKMPDAAIEKIRKEAREEIKKEIEAYFKGLIAIPDPQATLKSLLSSLTKE